MRGEARTAIGQTHRVLGGEGLATWGAYHAARVATRGAIEGGRFVQGAGGEIADAIKSPSQFGENGGQSGWKGFRRGSNVASRATQAVAHAVSNPVSTARRGVAAVNNTVGTVAGVTNRATNTAPQRGERSEKRFLQQL